MTALVSYAQNFEDVMLWRALKHIDNGFYIDLGAQDPLIDSVSLAFHERGWRGVHVEPTPHYAQLLRAQRPGDTVIEGAVSDAHGLLTFFEIPETGISTGDPEIAQKHRKRGFTVNEITVPSIRLSAIFESCVKGKQDVHWMKIDVEGFERSALLSWGKASLRPWIVVVESTVPMTQIESHQQWEPLLLQRGYMPAYFDGLNRFYVLDKHPDLLSAFTSGPNVFDGFTFNGTSSVAFWGTVEQRYKAKLADTTINVLALSSEVEDLKRNIAAREAESGTQRREFSEQSDSQKDQLLNLEHHRAQREEAFNTYSNDQSHQRELLMRQLAAMEHEDAEKFAAWQQKTEGEREQLRHRYFERERELELRLLSLQEVSTSQLNELRKKIEAERTEATGKLNELRNQLDAERIEAIGRLHELRAQVEAERTVTLGKQDKAREQLNTEQTLAKSQIDELRNELSVERKLAITRMNALLELQLKMSERERTNSAQLLTAQLESSRQLGAVHQEAKVRERHLEAQIEFAQRSVEQLRQQAQVQNENYRREIEERDQHVKEVDETSRLRVFELLSQLDRLQATRLELLQNISSLRLQLLEMKSSLSWRLTVPARMVSTFFFPSPVPKRIEVHDQIPPAPEMSRVSVQDSLLSLSSLISSHSSMQTSTNAVLLGTVGNSLPINELSEVDDEGFIRAAYQHVLGREVDSDGYSHYLDQLRTGSLRSLILSQLRMSPEGMARAAIIPQLDDDLAVATNAQAPASTLEELLECQGFDFVRAAYITLLGREPDTAGKENCFVQLLKGCPKIEILKQLRESAEGQTHSTNGQSIANAVRRLKVSQNSVNEVSATGAESLADQTRTESSAIDEMLTADDQRFIQLAFWKVLGRRPDPYAFGTYLSHLAAGVTRIQILSDIVESPEAENRAIFVASIESLIHHLRLSRLPLIGTILRLIMPKLEKQDSVSTTLRAYQFENMLWRKCIEQRIAQNEIEIAANKVKYLELTNCTPSFRDRFTSDVADSQIQVGQSSEKSLDEMVTPTLRQPVVAEAQRFDAAVIRRISEPRIDLENDPHVLEVLTELRSALTSVKKASNENSN